MSIDGGCLCENVRYQCQSESGGGHCHCIDCRKTSGTGHGSHMIVTESEFKVSGEMKFFDKAADSGNMISRGFCPSCGSAIYSTNSAMPGMVFVRASSLDDAEDFKPQMVVYTGRAPSWDHMDDALPGFDAMPAPEDMPAAISE